MKVLGLCVAAAVAFAPLSRARAMAAVSYIYDSGAYFTGGLYTGYYQPAFGTHYTATFTFSKDVDPLGVGTQCLYDSTVSGTCGNTLLNWSVTTGTITLDPSNAHIVPHTGGSNNGLLISFYTGYQYVLAPSFTFEIAGNDLVAGYTFTSHYAGASNHTGDINIVADAGGYRALNTGGYGGAVGYYNYTGPGGLPTGGTGGTGSGSQGTAVPEPAIGTLLLGGLAIAGGLFRRRAKAAVA